MAATSLLVSGSAFAATSSANLVVSAEVHTPRTCSISTSGNLDFGSYDPTSGATQDGTGSVVVNCTTGTAYTLTPDWGIFGNPGMRVMAGPMGLANYELYSDSDRSLVWAQGQNIVNATGDGTNQGHTVYGKLFGWGPTADGFWDGSYTDMVAMLVEYTP